MLRNISKKEILVAKDQSLIKQRLLVTQSEIHTKIQLDQPSTR